MIDQKGLELVSDFLYGKYSHIAIGTGSEPESVNDTTLEDEVHRGASTNTRFTTTVLNDSVRFYYRYSPSSGITIKEFGLFDSVSSGNIFAREVTENIIIPTGNFLDVYFNVVAKED